MNSKIRVKSKLSSLILILSLITISISSSFGAIDVCPGNTIPNLNGATQTETYSIRNHSIPSNTTHYYKFTPAVTGTIQVNSYVNKLYNSLSILNDCNTVAWENTGNSYSKSSTAIPVTAGKEIIISLERRYSSSATYDLDFTFTYIPPFFSIDNITLNEGNYGIYTKKIPVTLRKPNGSTTTVDYTTSNGTAIGGNDYNAASGTLTFSGTTTTQMISVDINGDNVEENDESFYITLSNPTGGASIDDSSAIVTLVNDDGGSTNTGERDFIIRNPINTRNIKGNIKTIGNSVLCYKGDGDTCRDTDSANNHVFLSFIKNISSYNNSSTATIAGIPSTATIVWAGFYSQGFLGQGYSTTRNRIQNNPSYLIRPDGTRITIQPNVIDLYNFSNNEYTYSTFTEVPELIGLSGNNANGDYTGANIVATEGDDDSSLGYFAAWSLVIIYSDDSETLKNISVFDGYKQIGGADASIEINGFLTPTTGQIKSTLSVFVGEGDKNIDGDTIAVNNVSLPASPNGGAFNSTINGFTAIPNPINFQGIDIHNYNIGVDGDTSHPQIIGGNESYAKIDFGSDGDYYYPSMISFTTELYEPRVCYSQKLLDENGDEITSGLNIGDTITISTWISNMKKIDETTGLPETGDLETADKVEISMKLDSENLEYVSGTTTIKNINENVYNNKTDSKDSDISEFLIDTNTSIWRVGTGASGSNGGQLLPNLDGNDSKKAFIKFKTTLLSSGDITVNNKYFVSYENSLLGVRFGDESPFNIELCEDFNSDLSIGAPLGVFNVVNQNFLGSNISDDPLHSQNALYTQVSGQNFTVKILALESNFQTLKTYNGDVNLSIIDAPAFTGNTSSDEQLCNIASESSTQTIPFVNESSKDLTLNYTKAAKKVSFKITYVDEGTTKHVCSRDSFSIRPATYSMDMNETRLIGNRDYRLDINATQSGVNINALGYTQIIDNSIDKNATTQLDVNTTSCTNPSVDTNVTVFTTNFAFVDGQAQLMNYKYPRIGDVNITINDSEWTQVDQSMYNGKPFNDCIENNSTNTPNPDGKIGCLVSGMEQFVFSPKEFRNRLVLQDFDDGNFTYINNDRNMSARLRVNIEAILDNNATATNYTAGCFSKDINTTIRILPNPIDGWLTNDRTATQRIIFFDDQNITTTRENNNTGWMTLSSKEGNFTNGIADINASFNFDRDTSIPDEPFHIKRDDFNITVIDTADTNGSDFNRTAQDYNATFYYGQVYVQEQRFVGNGAGQPFFINYEVYSTSNRIRRADFNLTGWESPDNVNWYNNTRHLDNTPGDFNTSIPVARAINDNPGMTFTKMSFQRLQLTHTAPHKDKIVLTPSPWLVFNRFDNAATTFDFLVEFLEGDSTWAGEGRLGDTVDANVSTRQNRRIDW